MKSIPNALRLIIEKSLPNGEWALVTWTSEMPTVPGLYILETVDGIGASVPSAVFLEEREEIHDLEILNAKDGQWERSGDYVAELDHSSLRWLGPFPALEGAGPGDRMLDASHGNESTVDLEPEAWADARQSDFIVPKMESHHADAIADTAERLRSAFSGKSAVDMADAIKSAFVAGAIAQFVAPAKP